MREVIKLPAYRRLLAAYTLNEVAWWVATVSLAILIYRQTGSAVGAMAFYLCAMFVPALIAPALVARLDQLAARTVLPLLYAVQAATYAALAAIATQFELAAVLALVLLTGLAAQAARALARTTAVAVTSPVGLLREGNALTNAAAAICQLAAPAVGGALVATGSPRTALLVNVALFAVIGLTVLFTRGLPEAVPNPAPTAGRLRAALAYAATRRVIRSLLALQAVALLFFTITIPVEVVLAQHSLHAGAGGYAAMLSSWGGGAVLGSLAYTRWRRVAAAILIAIGAGALAAGMGVMAAAPTLFVACVGAALGGIGNGIEAVAARTALQEVVEQSWMARIMSLNESLFQALPGAGILLGGSITAIAGPRVALAVAGAGALVIAGAAVPVLRGATPAEQPTDIADAQRPRPPAAAARR